MQWVGNGPSFFSNVANQDALTISSVEKDIANDSGRGSHLAVDIYLQRLAGRLGNREPSGRLRSEPGPPNPSGVRFRRVHIDRGFQQHHKHGLFILNSAMDTAVGVYLACIAHRGSVGYSHLGSWPQSDFTAFLFTSSQIKG